MKKYKYIIFFISLFLIFTINIYARSYTNYNTTFTINYNDEFFDNKIAFGTTSMKDFYETITHLSSNYYDLVIAWQGSYNSSQNTTNLYLFEKGKTYVDTSIYYANSNLYFKTTGLSRGYRYALNSDSNNYNSTSYTNFYNCFVNNSCSGYDNSFTTAGTSSTFGTSISSVSNDSSYVLPEVPLTFSVSGILYYSSVPLKLTNTLSDSNNTYYKSIVIGDTTYTLNDIVPTYSDLYSLDIDTSYVKQWDNQVNTLYSKVPIDKVNNFSMTFEFSPFSTSLDDYISLGFQIFVFGRVNNSNNYYTYDKLYCDFYDIQKDTLESSIKYTFSGIVCDSIVTLSDYDNIYFTLVPNYSNWNNELSKEILGIKLNANYGNFIYNKYSGDIYESFIDLSNYFKLFLSSTGNLSLLNNVSLFSSNYSTWYSAYNLNDLSLYTNYRGRISQSGDIFSDFPILTDLHLNDSTMLTKDYGFMVYDNDNIDSTDLHLFFDDNIVLSFGTNDNFYYYNTTTNQIENSNISIQYEVDSSSNDYDISSSINSINSYIDSFSQEINQFGDLIQEFFDNLPEYVRGFIYIMFNLVCLKQVIKLIKNDNGKE